MLEDRMEEDFFGDSPEAVFFRYAAPCGEEMCHLGLISKGLSSQIFDYLNKRKIPSRDFLESVYVNAIRRIDEVAKKLERGRWDSFVIRTYFIKFHNIIIDSLDGNYKIMKPSHRELCKVKVGKVINKYKTNTLLTYDVQYEDGAKQRIIGENYPIAEVGDKISTHWNFAVEKISNNEK
jgi:hypothetical protein